MAKAKFAISRVLLIGQLGANAGALGAALGARGLQVRAARTAHDALAMAQGFAPQVVIVHWQALDVVGPKFLRMLLDEKLAEMPFIIANAAPLEMSLSEREEALLSGADATLSAEPKSSELDAVLAVASRQKGRAAASDERLRRILSRLNEVQERFDSLDSDLSEAKKLQQSLLRDRQISLGDAQISLLLRSSGHVGGDLVGHFPINDEALGFYAIDVSGHGVSSALMTARLAGYLSGSNPHQNLAIEMKAGAACPRSPADAITDLNALVMEDLETDHYFTMILGYVLPAQRKVVFAQAGHPHPARQAAGGRTEFIVVGGLPVGLIPGAEYAETEITLAPGERLILLSDGFTEATLPDQSFLGEPGLAKLLDASRDQTGTTLLETLVWDLAQATGEDTFQ
ncbi:MAG: PP2C family protein-serine/threonine phosphatase, partial [Pseudomonadota bacterium]